MSSSHTTINLFSVPRVGVSTFIIRKINGVDCVLVGKRKGSHGEGCYQLPGGHLDYGETWEECCKREVKEETNLDVNNISFITCTNDLFEKEQRHYVTIFLRSFTPDNEQQAELLEPNKCEGWQWIEIEKLKELDHLFLPLETFLKSNSVSKILP
ncbi:hypothetical protein FDP41_012474 [Naegleria fowleri]|uniref:Nudix hydrolase domain-containing protein n=1 Tax=Naegleria fowleri TaxID=5763 RepID=A0A6A5BX25_NAEFO|nr:uncharacterized protein FDP41_012474 [Naegleria fowleri]KAF0981817.1 hypothetical protein FDP41_012474 [Naegleria fowleri]CAG4711693.1 unnamed protein product [Naegleria fowleri]